MRKSTYLNTAVLILRVSNFKLYSYSPIPVKVPELACVPMHDSEMFTETCKLANYCKDSSEWGKTDERTFLKTEEKNAKCLMHNNN